MDAPIARLAARALQCAAALTITCAVARADAVLPSGMGVVAPVLTTVASPEYYEIAPGSGLDGVAALRITTPSGNFGCTGSLLSTGMHVLTAAHCVTDSTGQAAATSVEATFAAGGGAVLNTSSYVVHPDWTGLLFGGGDLAILELSESPGVAGYDIVRDQSLTNDIIAILAGYGTSGTGVTGNVLPFGTLRAGFNRIDGVWPGFLFGGSPFAFDFDSGLQAHDFLGFLSPLAADLGLGVYEAMAVPGDSGGPTFTLDGKILGVHSFIGSLGRLFDPEAPVGVYGDFGGDTRVAAYADWIDSTLLGGPFAPVAATGLTVGGGGGVFVLANTHVPEPTVLGLLAFGLAGLARTRRAG